MLGDAPNQYSGIDITAMGKAVNKATQKFAPKAAKAQKNFVKGRMKEMRQDANEKLAAKNAEKEARYGALRNQQESLQAREKKQFEDKRASRPARAEQLRAQKTVAKKAQAVATNRAVTGRQPSLPAKTTPEKNVRQPQRFRSQPAVEKMKATLATSPKPAAKTAAKPAANSTLRKTSAAPKTPTTRKPPQKRGK